MQTILLPALAAIVVFVAFLLLMPRWLSSDEAKRKKNLFAKMTQESPTIAMPEEDIDILKNSQAPSGVYKTLRQISFVQEILDLIPKAGIEEKKQEFLVGIFVLFLVLAFIMRNIFLGWIPVGLLAALYGAYFVPKKYLLRRVTKRNNQFLTLFPDAIDMIIRSIRSGHPLNAAMRLIAENMDEPVRGEFKQVVDEVAYGRSLTEALGRMAKRIGESDLNFFVVVLSVQQETGGSLAEVLTNFSGVIRKRRQLQLKIRALTSEGRATAWVLGGLPVIEFLILYLMTPTYMDPLLHTSQGHIIVGIALTLITGAMLIVRNMINVDI